MIFPARPYTAQYANKRVQRINTIFMAHCPAKFILVKFSNTPGSSGCWFLRFASSSVKRSAIYNPTVRRRITPVDPVQRLSSAASKAGQPPVSASASSSFIARIETFFLEKTPATTVIIGDHKFGAQRHDNVGTLCFFAYSIAFIVASGTVRRALQRTRYEVGTSAEAPAITASGILARS